MQLSRIADSEINETVELIDPAYDYKEKVKGSPTTNAEHLRQRANETEFYDLDYMSKAPYKHYWSFRHYTEAMQKPMRMKLQLNNTLKLAIGVQLAWIVAAGLFALFGRPVYTRLLIANLLLLFVPAILERVTRTKLPMVLQASFYIFVTASSLMGSVLGFYGLILNWDTYVHVASGVTIAWYGLFGIRQAESKPNVQLPLWLGVISAFALPMALASLWEVYEYSSDQIFNTAMQAGGLEDTIIDMAAAIMGGIVATLTALVFIRPKSVLPKSFMK